MASSSAPIPSSNEKGKNIQQIMSIYFERFTDDPWVALIQVWSVSRYTNSGCKQKKSYIQTAILNTPISKNPSCGCFRCMCRHYMTTDRFETLNVPYPDGPDQNCEQAKCSSHGDTPGYCDHDVTIEPHTGWASGLCAVGGKGNRLCQTETKKQ